MINIINRTYEILFCMFFLESTPLLEIDRMFSEAIGKNDRDDELDLSAILEEYRADAEGGNPLKKYEIGQAFPGLSNFRILSRAHAERLEENDFSVLERLINEDDEEAFEKALEIVRKTYKEIMCVNLEGSDRMTCLGPYPDVQFCFDDDAIVLGLVIDEPDVSENIMANIRKIAKNMKGQLFADISAELDAKIELFISIGGEIV